MKYLVGLFCIQLLFFSYGFASSILVHENGNVGIGVANPIYGFHVKRDIGDYAFWFENKHATASKGMLIRAGEESHWSLGVQNKNHDDLFTVQGSGTTYMKGNVGINTTSPSYKLDVSGTIRGSNVSPSDARWKTNIQPIEDPLEKVAQLRGVTYEWADPSKGIGEQIGVIAQEVEQVFPQAVSTDNEGYKSVAYARLAAPMIEAIKELKNENELLKQEVSELKSAVQTLIKERETR